MKAQYREQLHDIALGASVIPNGASRDCRKGNGRSANHLRRGNGTPAPAARANTYVGFLYAHSIVGSHGNGNVKNAKRSYRLE
jgi:hypothetical protein